MKYIRQFAVILVVSFAGEVLRALIPLQIPASIYGLVLMFAALCTGIIPLDAVKDTGKYLIEIMPLMFIPATTGLIASWDKVQPILVPLAVISLVSTLIVLLTAGRVTQYVIRHKSRRCGKRETS